MARPRARRRAIPGPLAGAAAMVAGRRRDLGLTQLELSELAGISERSLQALEGGAEGLRMVTFLRAAEAVGLGVVVVPRSQARLLERAGAAVLRTGPPPSDDGIAGIAGIADGPGGRAG